MVGSSAATGVSALVRDQDSQVDLRSVSALNIDRLPMPTVEYALREVRGRYTYR